MDRILIDQDELCKHCKKNEIAHPDNCEGGRCDDAKDSYFDEHGLIEDEAQTFGDLTHGSKLFRVEDGDIHIDTVSQANVSKDGLRLSTNVHSMTDYPANKSTKTRSYNQGNQHTFVRRADAIKFYRESIAVTMERMIVRLMNFEKGE